MQHDDGDVWARRPLSRATRRYAAGDALLTHRLHEALAPRLASDGLLARVQRASDARVREFRDASDALPQVRTAAHAAAPDF